MKVKVIDNGYITAIGEGMQGIEISDEEYGMISLAILNAPEPETGYVWRLKENLTWDKCEYHEAEVLPEDSAIALEERIGEIEDALIELASIIMEG